MVALHHFMNARRKKEQSLHFSRSQECLEKTTKETNKRISDFYSSSYLLPNARAEFQTDIMENKLKQEEEERYAFRVLDAFSRFAYFPFIKSNNSEDALKAWKEEFHRNGGSRGNKKRDEETAFLAGVEDLDGLGIVHQT